MRKYLIQLKNKYIDYFTFNFFYFMMKRKLAKHQKLINGKILDIGCGKKTYEKNFKMLRKYIGTNSSEYYLGNYPKKQTDYIVNDGCNLPFKAFEFDAVLNFQVLSVFKDPNLFLSEIRRILKNSGIVIITTGFIYPIWNEPFNYSRFTKYGLENLANDNKFNIIAIEGFGGYFNMQARLLPIFVKTQFSILYRRIYEQKSIFKKIGLSFFFLIYILFYPIAPILINCCTLMFYLLDFIYLNENIQQIILWSYKRKFKSNNIYLSYF